MHTASVTHDDHFMHERFERAVSAVTALSNICENANYETARQLIDTCFQLHIFEQLGQRAQSARAQIDFVIQEYELTLANFVTQENKFYHAILSCENFGSRICTICADLRANVVQLLDLITLIESIDAACATSATSANAGEITHAMADALESLTSPPARIPYTYVRSSTIARAGASVAARARAKKKMRDSAMTQVAVPRRGSDLPSQIIQRIAAAKLESGKSITAIFADIKYLLYQTKDIIQQASEIKPQPSRAIDLLSCETCGAKLRAARDSCELTCQGCGRIDFLVDDRAAANAALCDLPVSQDTLSKSRGGYDYMRHLQIWLDRLQANESYEFKPHDVEKVRKSILNSQSPLFPMNWRIVTCADVIRHLSLCHLPNLGEHVPKLLKELGGCPPPILNYEARQIILRDFQNIMSIYAQVVERGSVNKPYYPFFIAKIIKRRFKDRPERRLLEYIARQGTETVNKHDRIYERICRMAPQSFDLKYEPEID